MLVNSRTAFQELYEGIIPGVRDWYKDVCSCHENTKCFTFSVFLYCFYYKIAP